MDNRKLSTHKNGRKKNWLCLLFFAFFVYFNSMTLYHIQKTENTLNASSNEQPSPKPCKSNQITSMPTKLRTLRVVIPSIWCKKEEITQVYDGIHSTIFPLNPANRSTSNTNGPPPGPLASRLTAMPLLSPTTRTVSPRFLKSTSHP